MIEIYTANTPNGVKIPIALEEMGAEYRINRINLTAREQKSADFLKISPNGRIPAIVDTAGPGGKPLSIFESGAILIYLAEKFGQLLPQDPVGRVRALEWTFFQVGGVGPMFGQAGVFRRHDVAIPFAIERYEAESQRLVEVMDAQLASHPYLAGDSYSIADIAHIGWLDIAERYAGVNLSPLIHLSRWREQLRARPGVQRGLAALA